MTTGPMAPLREALLARARAAAADTVAAADAAVQATLAEARAEAASLLTEARAVGEREADAVLAAERARSARDARAVVLAARRAAFDDLRRRARTAVGALRDDPDYPEVLEELRERVRRELGPEAYVAEHERGGIVGRAGGRRMTFTLDDLADRIVDDLGGEVEGLWSP